jgi:DNA invertase Pin-like site-specific DNA recombinase
MGRTYGYARVSTTRQDFEIQVAALEEAGCDKVFREKVSGKNRERPELRRLMRIAESGDVVIFYKLDRLSRTLRDGLNILKELSDRGVGVRFLNDPIDTTPADNPLAQAMRDAFLSIIGVFAQLERDLIVARTSGGREAAKAKGVPFGRTPKLSAGQLESARILIANGKSVGAVAADMKVNRSTLYRYLNEEGHAEHAAATLAARPERRR